jgi:hypothetical protein
MGSTRKKNGGKKKTLKYGGRRNNYKKGSFKNRRKMTIRNGGGRYNFKDTDTKEKTKVKLERMYEKIQNESSKNKDQMLASWRDYISRLVEPKKSEMLQLEESVKAKYPHSTGRSHIRPAASASASAARAPENEDDLYRELNQLVLTESKKTREEYNKQLRQFRQITGKDPSSDEMSDADLQAALADAVSGRRYPGFTADEAAEAELARIAKELKSEESEEH